ncbi:hypothetical protein BSR29_05220 [Boudabousia liubingyangii]|uniref:biotin--[biotin carboxyl-carrier protein] ligase n=1 Tax=Boudabousia liubingyangii TaxID=1921764 RepID=A0A1Q5PLF6_9ACTO|nr:hypothetical protein [Boudabousia liubingyangii]OKL47048.1 hypothetical protein BSR28_06460 [Boudabousia liubingyangii]OKL47891.1 hypothetical protein BSR29_05220 [Boudabousia liubingyangii]
MNPQVPIIQLPEVTSTQDEVRFAWNPKAPLRIPAEELETNAIDLDARLPVTDLVPFGLQASHQSQGRGRFNRTWEDHPSGSILLSLAVQLPQQQAHQAGWLPGLLSLAAAESINQLAPEVKNEWSLKWPNDLWLSGKLAGTLAQALTVANQKDGSGAPSAKENGSQTVENSEANGLEPKNSKMAAQPQRYICGIGMNLKAPVTTEELPYVADLESRLLNRAPQIELDPWVWGQQIADNFLRILKSWQEADWDISHSLLPYFESKLLGLGREVTFQQPGPDGELAPARTGVIRGITSEGALKLEVDDNLLIFTSGELTFPNKEEFKRY